MMQDQDLLIRYVQNDASPDERLEVESWVESSPENRRTLEEYLRVWAHAGPTLVLDNIDVDSDWDKVRNKLNGNGRVVDMKPQPRRTAFPWRMAAAILLLVGVGLGFLLLSGPGESVLLTEMNPPEANPKEVSLPAGHLATLNQSSTLQYFEGEGHKVSLDGEAYFQVKKGSEKGLAISTNEMLIRVTGTEFNLRSYPGEDSTVLNLYTGSVTVQVPNGEEALEIEPGQKVTSKNGKLTVSKIPNQNHLAWKTGRLTYLNHPLTDVVKDLEALFGTEISLESPVQANNCLVRSTFENQDLNSILEELRTILGIEYKRSGNVILITKIQC